MALSAAEVENSHSAANELEGYRGSILDVASMAHGMNDGAHGVDVGVDQSDDEDVGVGDGENRDESEGSRVQNWR